MDHKRASEIIEKYLAGDCTPEEQVAVEQALDYLAQHDPELFPEELLQSKIQFSLMPVANATIYRKSTLRKFLPYATAAVVVLTLAIGYLFSERKDIRSFRTETVKRLQDVTPGGNYAILTLPNGQKINLNKANKGNILNNFFTIKKRNEGEVVFNPSPNSSISTIETPRGGQFIVQLPDGSKVWMNAASSIQFPGSFEGQSTRRVTLSGEAYFEVAKNEKQPFIVKTTTQEVEVLGTHFYVNSYPDEQTVRTILREGAVRVTFSTQLKNVSETLKPGQMAVHQGKEIIVKPLDEDLVAWREKGKLMFRDSDLPSIMRQVSKWYDLTVKYEGSVPTSRFTANISRDSNLSELLRILEGMGVHFTLEQQGNEKVLIVKN